MMVKVGPYCDFFVFALQFLNLMIEIGHFIKSFLARFFLPANQLDLNLQLVSLIVEQITYVMIINRVNLLSLFYSIPDGFATFLALITLSLAKYFLKISLIAAIGLALLQILLESHDEYSGANYSLLGVLYIAEAISSTSFDFNPCSFQSESHNSNKITHRILIIANIVLINLLQGHIMVHMVSSCLYSLLFLLKDQSLVKNESYRAMSLRFYLWATCDHFKLFLGNFVSTGSLAALIITFLISQSLYLVYSYYCRRIDFAELLARQQYLKLSFQILRYKHSFDYNELQQKSMQKLLIQEEMQLNQENPLDILQLVSSKLDRCDGFLQSMLKIQMLIDNGRLLSAKTMLERLKDRQEWFNLLNYILLDKAERQLRDQFKQGKANVTLIYEQEYMQFVAFQSLIYKGAMQNLKLNTYLGKSEVELIRVKAICSKIIAYQAQIDRKYRQIQDHFIVSTEYYIVYLVKIKNQYSKALNILNKHIITERYLFDYRLDEKLYIRFGLNENGMMIEKIGFNSKQLLGYERLDLQGQKMEKFVPHFYRGQHQKLSSNFIRDKLNEIFLFQKKTVILNSWKTYSQASIILKLNYSISGQFYYDGHLQVIKNENYDLKSFFYLNQQGKILQSSDSLFKLDDGQVTLHISQFFRENAVGKPLTQLRSNRIESFHPIISFNGSEGYYFYAKKSITAEERRKCASLKSLQYIKQSKPEKTLQSTHFQQIQGKVKNKQIYILLLLIFIFLSTLFGSEYLLRYSAYIKFNHQNFMVSTGKNLMKYYNGTFILGMDMTYVDLRDNFDYRNSLMDLNEDDAAIALQSLNEHLKQFNQGKYNISNPISTYSKSNFQIVGMLIANSLMYSKFQNDSIVKQAALDSLRQIIPVLFMSSFTDYRISIFSLMNSFVQIDLYYEKLSLGISIANIIIFAFVFLRLFNRLGQIEEIALSFRCQAFPRQQKIDQILQFMHELTHQEIPLNQFQQAITQNCHKADPDSAFLRTEMSFVKDTGRVLNDSQIIAGNAGEKNCVSSQFWFVATKSYRMILVIVAIFIVLLLSLVMASYFLNNTTRDIDQTISITSIVTLYRASAFYSRAIINSLSAMTIKNLKNIDRSTQYYKDIKSFNTYLSTFTIPQFPQTQFSQFLQYTKGLNLLYQERICAFTPCDPLYSQPINLNFITVISSLSLNLSRFVSETSALNTSALKDYINSPSISFYISLLFESQLLIRAYVLDLSIIYLDNYVLFMNNLLSSKLSFNRVMIAISILATLLFIYLLKFVRDEQLLLVNIVKIYG